MIAALIIVAMLWLFDVTPDYEIHSGYLSYANLQAVVERKGWQNTEDFVLLAPADCGLMAKQGWLITESGIFLAVICDCEALEDAGQMAERRLLADTNRLDLVHEYAFFVVR